MSSLTDDYLGRVRKKKFIWITNPQYKYDFHSLEKHQQLYNYGIPVFVNSCNKEFCKFFTDRKFETLVLAKEAILKMDVDHFESKSLKELVKRGLRHGKVEEMKFSPETQQRVEEFKKLCVHGKEPQLKYLFLDKLREDSRLFVFQDEFSNWLGAISISASGKKIYSHLLLRKKGSPVGIMEALIFSIYNKLKEENCTSWSLGDVPFIVFNSKLFSKQFLINFIGRRCRYAYNYLGLYKFKNKFHPIWEDSYLCCKPKISFKALVRIANASHFTKLVLYKLKNINPLYS